MRFSPESASVTGTTNDSRPETTSIEEPRILVFCNTKRQVDQVNNALCRVNLRSAAIHGDKAQTHRTRVLDWFRRGRINILVASSVSAFLWKIDNYRVILKCR